MADAEILLFLNTYVRPISVSVTSKGKAMNQNKQPLSQHAVMQFLLKALPTIVGGLVLRLIEHLAHWI